MLMLTRVVRRGIALSAIKGDNGRSRNILIHHGLMGSSHNFTEVVKHPVITSRYSRNHGESPHTSTHTIADLADDLLEYVRKEGLGRRLTLMGHSMGGQALMEFTKRHYSSQIQAFVDRVILIDIPTDRIHNYPAYQGIGGVLKALNRINLTQPLTAIHSQIDKILPQDLAAVVKANIVQEGEKYRWKVNMEVLAQQGFNSIGDYSLNDGRGGQWRKPVEFIYGGKSDYYDAEHRSRLSQHYPQMKDGNFHCVPEAGHWVFAERPTEFLQILETILQRDDHQ